MIQMRANAPGRGSASNSYISGELKLCSFVPRSWSRPFDAEPTGAAFAINSLDKLGCSLRPWLITFHGSQQMTDRHEGTRAK